MANFTTWAKANYSANYTCICNASIAGLGEILPSEKYRLYSMHIHVCRMKVESTVILRWLGSKIH